MEQYDIDLALIRYDEALQDIEAWELLAAKNMGKHVVVIR